MVSHSEGIEEDNHISDSHTQLKPFTHEGYRKTQVTHHILSLHLHYHIPKDISLQRVYTSVQAG